MLANEVALGQVHDGHTTLAKLTLDAVSALKGSVQSGDGVGGHLKGDLEPIDQSNQNFADDVPRWPVTTRSDPITCVFTALYVTQAVPVRLLPCRDTYCILP